MDEPGFAAGAYRIVATWGGGDDFAAQVAELGEYVNRPMLIPAKQLSASALRGLIEEFITREGTDYGAKEYSLADKVSHVERQITAGDVVIAFDAEQNSCTLLPRDEAEQALLD